MSNPFNQGILSMEQESQDAKLEQAILRGETFCEVCGRMGASEFFMVVFSVVIVEDNCADSQPKRTLSVYEVVDGIHLSTLGTLDIPEFLNPASIVNIFSVVRGAILKGVNGELVGIALNFSPRDLALAYSFSKYLGDDLLKSEDLSDELLRVGLAFSPEEILGAIYWSRRIRGLNFSSTL